MKNREKTSSKASRNYYFNLFSFLPFVFLLFTGIVVLRYHGGAPYETKTFGIDGNVWLWVHRITALVNIPIIAIHLILNVHWLKKLVTFTMNGKNNGMNLTLFIVFIVCVTTGLLAWFAFEGEPLGQVLREVHNKLGLLLIFFFIIHLSNYYKWFLHMTKKYLGKNK